MVYYAYSFVIYQLAPAILGFAIASPPATEVSYRPFGVVLPIVKNAEKGVPLIL